MKAFVAIVLLLGLTACVRREAPGPQPVYLVSDVTTFHQLASDAVRGKTLVILAYPADRQGSLEFATYRAKLTEKFRRRGFDVIDDTRTAAYTAFVSYGIDNGMEKISTRSTPLYGVTGYDSYTMPTYGITGYASDIASTRMFTRNLAIDIVETKSLAGSSPVKLYEGRAVSRGRCSSFATVFPDIAESMFVDFPGINGKTSSVTIEQMPPVCLH
jgi:hypothetical protein